MPGEVRKPTNGRTVDISTTDDTLPTNCVRLLFDDPTAGAVKVQWIGGSDETISSAMLVLLGGSLWGAFAKVYKTGTTNTATIRVHYDSLPE